MQSHRVVPSSLDRLQQAQAPPTPGTRTNEVLCLKSILKMVRFQCTCSQGGVIIAAITLMRFHLKMQMMTWWGGVRNMLEMKQWKTQATSNLSATSVFKILFVTLWTVACQTPVHGTFQAKILKWVAIFYSRNNGRLKPQVIIECL